jgi:ribosomal protein S18 acetylase RimI-like enzyme
MVDFDHRDDLDVGIWRPVSLLRSPLQLQKRHTRRRPMSSVSNFMSPLSIRSLEARDADAFQKLRLQGLKEFPAAFASSYEEECDLPLDSVAARLGNQAYGVVLGAFNAHVLVGMMGVRREHHRKLAHKALLWGVYVAPEGRKCGVGQMLGRAALDFAKARLGVRQVTLGVGADNAAAIALYRRLGFEPFGIEPGYLFVDGEYRDEMHMIHVFDVA